MNTINKKVLLINLPGESIRKPEEHCGLASLKAFLCENGLQVKILDAYARRIDIDTCKEIIAKWILENYKENKLFIGISPFVTSHKSFVKIGEFIKKVNSGCFVYAGGHYATLNKEYLLKHYEWLDAIIVGEGEITSLEMILNDDKENISGLYTRNNTECFIQRDRILNLDKLPFQDRYLNIKQLEGQPFAITTSRGCYGECSFCSISSFYKMNSCKIKQTYRSAKSVSDEIHYLIDKYEIDSIKIVDDNFFRSESDEFLEELVNYLQDVNISFRLSARPNDITEKRAKLLKKIGATIVGIGVESADNKSLKLFNKGIDIFESNKAIRFLNNNNITTLVNFIMFNPIIDIDGLEANCNFVEKYMNKSIFHRINSHLWIRSTDPIVDKLVDKGLCNRKGFPYVECNYLHQDIVIIRKLYDMWCNHNMKEYYNYADILMAKGIFGNETIYEEYKKMLKNDVMVLKKLITMSKENSIEKYGYNFISLCIEKGFYIEN